MIIFSMKKRGKIIVGTRGERWPRDPPGEAMIPLLSSRLSSLLKSTVTGELQKSMMWMKNVVRNRRKSKEQLLLLTSKHRRLPGAGQKKKQKLPDMEEQLALWIEHKRSQHLRVTRTAVQRKALELYQSEEEFAASRGWLEKFLKRHDFALRRRTTVCQRLPQDMITKVSTFILRVRKMRLLSSVPFVLYR